MPAVLPAFPSVVLLFPVSGPLSLSDRSPCSASFSSRVAGRLLRCLCALVCMCCCLCAAACSDVGDSGTEEAAVILSYLPLHREDLSLATSLPGRVTPLVISEVRPQVDGIIVHRLFEEGSFVQQGDVLYQIDPALFTAALHMARAPLAEAQASVTALAKQEERYRRLVRDRAVSRQDLEHITASHAEARARVDRARAEVEQASVSLAYTSVRAPVSGRIGASAVTPGALVTAGQAAPLATIQQLESVYVDMTQSAVEALQLRRALARGAGSARGGIRITLEDGSLYRRLAGGPASAAKTSSAEPAAEAAAGAFAGTPVESRLLFSETRVSESTGSVLLRAIFPNPDQLLLPGMYVTATLAPSPCQGPCLCPSAACLPMPRGTLSTCSPGSRTRQHRRLPCRHKAQPDALSSGGAPSPWGRVSVPAGW